MQGEPYKPRNYVRIRRFDLSVLFYPVGQIRTGSI